MSENTPIISFKDADILNGEATVIYSLDMEIYPSDFVYIVGKVGTGKTSIIRTMIAENKMKKGLGQVCEYDLLKIKNRDIPYLRRKLGVVFQDFQLLMDRSVEDNLRFVLKATGWKDEDDMDQRIKEVLVAVGMELKAHKMPFQLSGGEQQRVSIARALAKNPKLLLCDEPTGALDYNTGKQILKLLQETSRETGMTVIVITHNQAIAPMADRVISMKSGRVVDITTNPNPMSVEDIEW